LYPDSAYDPIASPESPFQGEFRIDGDVTSLSSVSAIGDITGTNGLFRGNLKVEGDLTVTGVTTQLDTLVYATSALNISNVGTGPALKVTQSGTQPIAHFIDSNGDDIVFNDNGFVGIGTMQPNKKLTVIGGVSASENLVVDGTVTATTMPAGSTDHVVIQDNGLLNSRDINKRVWDTNAEFLSARNMIPGFVPMYFGINTLVDSQIEYNGTTTIINGDATVTGNLTSIGSAYFANTLFTTTSSLSIVNTGPGPALYVYQSAGAYDVASFYDGDGIEVLHVGNSNPNGLGKVGINSSSPNVELTITGSVSATDVIYASGGNSNNWNSAYSNVWSNSANLQSTLNTTNLLSANWSSVYSNVQSNSANWQSTFVTTSALSATWSSVYSSVIANSANWLSTFVTTSALSANWNSVYSNVQSNSGNWQNTFTTVSSTSGSWSNVYATVVSNSASWNTGGTGGYQGTDIKALTANWQGTYTTVSSNSANWLNSFANAAVQTFSTPLTASGKFLVATINGVQQAIRLWDI
jgi:hypothetical protein